MSSQASHRALRQFRKAPGMRRENFKRRSVCKPCPVERRQPRHQPGETQDDALTGSGIIRATVLKPSAILALRGLHPISWPSSPFTLLLAPTARRGSSGRRIRDFHRKTNNQRKKSEKDICYRLLVFRVCRRTRSAAERCKRGRDEHRLLVQYELY